MALALHNQQTIPDPKRLMPGVVISTPDVTELERHYASVIPKAAPMDVVVPVASTQSRKSENLTPGYFVTREGDPMYRVSDKDTLTGIARRI